MRVNAVTIAVIASPASVFPDWRAHAARQALCREKAVDRRAKAGHDGRKRS
jgi:hypothetical protein